MTSIQQDRYPVYDQLRSNTPVLAEPSATSLRTYTTWHLTRYDDCLTALRDPRFVHEERKYLAPEVCEEPGENISSLTSSQRNWMLFKDPPDHTRLRSLVQRAFTPKIVQNLQPRMEHITTMLLDEMEAQTEVDLVQAYAFPLPVMIIATLLGVPMQDREQFRAWSNILFQSLDFLVSDTTWEQASQAVDALRAYLRDIVHERVKQPQDDLISGMVRARDEHGKLSEDELLDNCILMLAAGHETTVNLIANGVYLLLREPEALVQLQRDWTLLPSAVEEILRYESPIQVTTRFVSEDVQLGDVTLKKGDYVSPWLGAANRDPAKFTEPDRFDITRDPNRHLAFGQGIHFCLGAPLARLEGQVAIKAYFQRFPKSTFVGDQAWAFKPSVLTRSLAHLKLKVAP
ncbi:cytochrome P450 [Alicyclobacillus fodiniaquatilis]|uniref:Cytochrome P450 n=1 Tax=Alicyclobacillus fodiniaquatilis TaxID=1661150 RepID=A0ABW4JEJ6_9BACL